VPLEMKEPGLAPQYEARYKLLDKLIGINNPEQILELASGLSPRGLNQTLENNSVKYAELELPEIVNQKIKIFSKIIPVLPKNLRVERGNALKFEDIERATSRFDPKEPITITHED